MRGEPEVLGVIIARGGSKGLPEKHLRPLLGQPLIAWTVGHARRSPCIRRLVCSTDSEAIAGAVRDLGVEVIPRPAALASDEAHVAGALVHAVEWLGEREGYRPRVVLLLYGNCPVRPEGVHERVVGHLLATGASSVRTFSPTGKYHPCWMSRIAGDRIEPWQETRIYRRQDLPSVHLHDGASVAIRVEALLAAGHAHPEAFYGEDPRGLVLEAGAVVEVDTWVDLALAEAL
ncbi:MAG: acylneuraminate cytidylyltransferase family protein, partial [Planctomycetes bacterium]|nr:acylneuraminate cytidylyltransferase family protein [Planctomycetota bacterium]